MQYYELDVLIVRSSLQYYTIRERVVRNYVPLNLYPRTSKTM